jgi:predicted membrane protein
MKAHTVAGIIIILIGLSILFRFPVINFIIAFFILWIGVKILTGQGRMGNFWSETKGSINEDYFRRVLVFSGIRTKLSTQNFEGMELVTIFGGGEIDAAAVSTKKSNIDIDLVSIFGGVKLRIPKGWTVKSEGTGIMGGFNNGTESPAKSGVTVHLKGAAIFGGVEIVN